jgi:PTS system nitrogen regulatory IIA component
MQLTTRDVARIFGVSERDVEKWIDEKDLPASRVGPQRRFNRMELLEWAATWRLPIPNELVPRGVLASFSESLEAGGIFYGLKGADKTAALRAVVDALPLPDGADRGDLLNIFLARERLGSTALGNGIAVPHVRHPVIVGAPRPLTCLFFLDGELDFDAPDGRPVRTLFVLITPTARVHLQFLSRLSLALRNPIFRQAVEKRADREHILGALRVVESGFLDAAGGPA